MPRVAASMPVRAREANVNRAEYLLRFMPGVAALDCEAESAIHFNSIETSRAVCQRSSGSLARQRRRARSSAAGVVGFTALMGAGSFSRMADATLSWLLPGKAR